MAQRLRLEQFKLRLDQVAHCANHYIRDLKCQACVHAWDTFLQLWPHIEAYVTPPPPKPAVLSLHRCKVCGTRWLLWPDDVCGGGWNLLDRRQRPGACCDNVAMNDQIEHLRDLPLVTPTMSMARHNAEQVTQEKP